MSVVSKTSGSQSATVTTEHTLATITDAGVYVLTVDTGNMANGDELELRAKTKIRSGDSSRLAYIMVYQNVQGEPNKYSIPVPIVAEVVFTLKQTTGTGRAYPWNVLQVG